MRNSPEILVVGAGPTGLTLGIELLRRGVPVRIVDREDRPHPHSKAIVLWPRTLEVFRRLGVAEGITERGLALPAANYYSGGRRVARIDFRTLAGSRYGTPLSLPQQQTEAVLRAELRRLGGEVEFGVTLRSLQASAERVRVGLDGPRGPEQAEVPWVVGCDGAHSTVRSLAGIGFHGLTYPQTFLLADGACDTTLAHDEAHYFMTDRGVLVVVGLPDGQYRVFGGVGSYDGSADPLAVLRRAAQERSPVPVRMDAAARTGVFRVHARQADRFQAGRVLLAGDAAHIHSPAGGQGLNTAVEDAHALGWRLALPDADAVERELDRWERERRQVAAEVVGDAHRQTRMWMLTGWRGQARDAALAIGQRTGLLNRLLPPRMARLHHTHPGHDAPVGRLVPGRRVPDAPLGGLPLVHVHDLLEAGRPVLLVLASDGSSAGRDRAVAGLLDTTGASAQPSPADAPGCLRVLTVPGPAAAESVRAAVHDQVRLVVDPSGQAHRHVGVPGPVAVLIRPDGVVDRVVRPGREYADTARRAKGPLWGPASAGTSSRTGGSAR
ncbi:FAD-dependent monooxygenase [Streptomyces rubradiris]|uniref:3-(3-hydroxyphenyl)propionate hydroxylase n=1 Tax=Streptomyces rubradiris TaxID=285531 RepID=A0ABQ3RQS3_STRRR|nr:FAD-dependent monooxygenase [Streptomyces rubradiris]GHH24821.1 3-(3-hydroxyphenyl)propionate hydroxylase [Streptomyces rubradiris]GHI58231.1 3-(3-hydroxyphenyl)propionate hydroxylase [Streptomyces rubradiris]